jgi:hypothetical protein
MANDKPTTWSLSKNPPIGNYGTIVDKKLTTITPTNPTGYTKLSTTSTDPVIQNMEYAIDTSGNVTYRFTNATGRQIEYSNIQEMVSPLSGPNQINNWDVNTTALFKNSLQANLTQRTQDIIINQTSPVSPFAQTPDVTTTDTSTDLNLTEGQYENLSIKSVGVRRGYDDDMRYPLDLNQNINQNQDVIHFKMYSSFDGTRAFTFPRFGERKDTAIPGSVTMAIQPRISDNNTVTWNDSNIDLMGMGMAGASLNTIQKGFDGTNQTINQIKRLFDNPAVANNVEAALKIAAAGAAASTQNLLSRLTGGIVNPNLELLFENPDLRVFTYNFQLSPREPKEAIMIRKIIRFFKQGMAVQRSEAELFLKAPNVFDIRYLLSGAKGAEHPYLNKIKRCALTNCGVDYTPTGSYMTFAGEEKSMVSYNLSLTFKELEPVYADEYESTRKFGRSEGEIDRGDGNQDTMIGF